MITILASFVALIAAVAAMAVGVIFGRAPIRGSCGGGSGGVCAACTGSCARRAAGGREAGEEKDTC